MIKYCLPIIKNTKEDILKIIDTHQNDYQLFEVWVDYIKDLDISFIEELSSKLEQKLIIVFRRQNLEKINMDFEKIKQIIEVARNNGSTIDLDFTTQQKELDFIQENAMSVKTIISYHNYEITPTEAVLSDIIKKMRNYSPYIYKVACMCNNEENAIRLLQLLINLKKQKLKFIVLGMGEKGIITRIFGSLWGNDMVFAPYTNDEKSALGQLTKEQFEEIFSKIL